MEGLQDQLQAPAALSRPGAAVGFRPHYAPQGGSKGTRSREPALCALVGDAACAPCCPELRGKQKAGGTHPDRIATRLRTKTICASLVSCSPRKGSRVRLRMLCATNSWKAIVL